MFPFESLTRQRMLVVILKPWLSPVELWNVSRIYGGIPFMEQLKTRVKYAKNAIIRKGENGSVYFTLPLELARTHYNGMYLIPQYDSEQCLLDACISLGLNVERQVELIGMETESNSSVKVTLKKAKNEEEKVECRFLIAADGAHSFVRHHFDLKFEGKTRDETFLMADGKLVPELHSHFPEISPSVFISNRGVCLVLPFPEPFTFRFLMNVPDEDKELLEKATIGVDKNEQSDFVCSVEDFCQRANVHLPFKLALQDVKWIATFRVNERLSHSFRVGNCFLMGDAAHVHSPAGGQGMNMGCQDAFNLAWKLSLVLRGVASDEQLLSSYEEERRPCASATLQGTGKATSLMTVKNKAIAFIRNAGISLVTSIISLPIFKQTLLSNVESGMQLRIQYKNSRIIAKASPFSTFLGCQFPNFIELESESKKKISLQIMSESPGWHFVWILSPLKLEKSVAENLHAETTSLINRFPGLVLIHFVGTTLESWPLEVESSSLEKWVDQQSTLLQTFTSSLKSTIVVLVRPDGYIADIQYDSQFSNLKTQLESYLK